MTVWAEPVVLHVTVLLHKHSGYVHCTYLYLLTYLRDNHTGSTFGRQNAAINGDSALTSQQLSYKSTTVGLTLASWDREIKCKQINKIVIME